MRWLAAALLCACSAPPAEQTAPLPDAAQTPPPFAPDAATPAPKLTEVRLGTLRTIGEIKLPGPALQLRLVADWAHPPSELVASALCASGTRLLRTRGVLRGPGTGPVTLRLSPPLAALPQRCELTLEAHATPTSGRRPRRLGVWCHEPSGTRAGPCPPRPWGERSPRAPPPVEVTDLLTWPDGNVAFTVTRWTSAPARAVAVRAGEARIRVAPQTAEVGVGIRHQVHVRERSNLPVTVVLADTNETLASTAP